MRSKILVLGGTSEASALCRSLAADASVTPILSLAGRTSHPALPADITSRVGGFGGTAGLAAYLRAERIDALIDATHPFAARMSRHAVVAAAETGTVLLALRRPEWRAQEGDRWISARDIDAAALALGPSPRRVFLAIGRQELAPFLRTPHDYLIRSVDPPDAAALPPHARVITARGPFALAEERALLAAHRIEVVVSKNAGGTAARAKLDAARELGLPVIMVVRPPLPDCDSVPDVASVLDWLAHRGLRGA